MKKVLALVILVMISLAIFAEGEQPVLAEGSLQLWGVKPFTTKEKGEYHVTIQNTYTPSADSNIENNSGVFLTDGKRIPISIDDIPYKDSGKSAADLFKVVVEGVYGNSESASLKINFRPFVCVDNTFDPIQIQFHWFWNDRNQTKTAKDAEGFCEEFSIPEGTANESFKYSLDFKAMLDGRYSENIGKANFAMLIDVYLIVEEK